MLATYYNDIETSFEKSAFFIPNYEGNDSEAGKIGCYSLNFNYDQDVDFI